MNEVPNKTTLVLGLGNPVLSDDRVGLAVAEEVKALLDRSPLADVDVACSTRGGFELIDLLSGYRHAILVDCLAVSDPKPGRVRELQLDRVAGSARLVAMHELSLEGVFALARAMQIPMPEEVKVFGVEGGELTLISEEMTPEVAAAVAPLAARLYDRLAASQPGREGPSTLAATPLAQPEKTGNVGICEPAGVCVSETVPDLV
jgi:hydrogenase maturation protease